ncbi:hypothetical protein [Thiocapsa roseopersicina]|nr:hypothetical protein [Thiocapsa roseopersicina]
MRTNTTMKLTALAAAMGMVMSAGAFADTGTATQTFDYQVDEVAVIALDGAAPSLIITNANVTAGATELLSTASSGNSWAVTSNAGDNAKKLVAELSAAMPTGVSLLVNVGGTTAGVSVPAELSLATTKADVVTGIDSVGQTGMPITYQLKATLAAGEVGNNADNTVIYTIIDSGV